MDFVALMKYGGPDKWLHRVLDRLEVESPEEVRRLSQSLDAGGYSTGREEVAVWMFSARRSHLRDPRLDSRPRLPNLGAALCLPEGFFLTFGPDAIELYHLLRWSFFLEEPPIQQAMLEACVCLGRLFGATDCIITSDFSPVVHEFRAGHGFDAALSVEEPEDGERANLADLSWEIPLGSVMRIVTDSGGRQHTRHRDLAVDQPPPEGWQRATTRESRGYWRMPLGPRLPDSALGPYLSEPHAAHRERPQRAAKGMDEHTWAISADPDAMLDYLLKQDEVSWRKVQLWACACLRRIWPQLVKEPCRRVVEVAERFADGQTTQQAAENAANEARKLKKGDRTANYAACVLGDLCSGRWVFPPGNVSEAVVDAVVRDPDQLPARAAERKEHADLLRDIFGPHPARPIAMEPSWLTPAVVAVAQAAYLERELPSGRLDNARLIILADALEDAGCTDAELLEHLRSPGPHVRGCWAVDLLMGRES
jgi:hypothetical protein